jgi:hypothetical protein
MRLAALLVVLLVTACAPASAQPSASPSPFQTSAPPVATATPAPTPTPTVYWPLRGTVAPNPEAIAKRPVLVRIPNDVSARPQTGLSKADMVWELLTEGGITRFMAVFHSEEVDQLGPIRSARLSDLQYAPMLRGILAHVGASTVVLAGIRAAAARGEFVDVDQFLYGDYYTRVSFRAPPQNVYTSTARLRAAAKAAGDGGTADVPGLAYSLGGPAVGADTKQSFTIPYLGAMRVTYSFDPGQDGYTRVQGGAKTIDAATGAPVVANNVIVIFTDITPRPGIVEDSNGSLSLDVRTTGKGHGIVFRDGTRYDVTWSREGNGMYTFALDSGLAVSLRPGQTWVHVVPADWTVTGAP